MYRKLTLTLVSGMIMLFTLPLLGQGGQCPPGDIITGTTCEEACWACDGQINGYMNTVPATPNPTAPNPLCGGGFVPNNTQWLAFVAGSPNITLSIDIFNCTQGNGMQAGIVSGCPDINNTAVVCSGACPGPNPIVLATTALTVGAVYWLWFDGCAGASCDYLVNVIAGITSIDPPDPTLPVTGPATGCPGGNPQQYLTSLVLNASVYDWIITPPAPFSVNAGGTGIIVNGWPAEGIYEVCVDAYNACYSPTGPQQCFEVVVTAPTPTDIGPNFYCPEDPGWPYPGNGMVYNEAGSPHEVVFTTALGCDSSVFIYVEPYVTEPGELDTAICFGDFAVIGGVAYTDPLFDVLIPLNPPFQTFQGCDSSVLVNLEVVRPIIQGFNIPEGLNCTNQSIGTTIFVNSPQFGDPNATWEWDTFDGFICGNPNSEILFVCDPGWYYVTLTLTDANGYASCTYVDSVEIIADLTLPTLAGSATTATCGEDVGTATVTIGDVMNPTVLWDTNAGNQATPTATGLAPGNYWVTVTGDNGCVDSLEVMVPGSPPIELSPQSITNVLCNGDANGSATIDVMNANGATTITWTPGPQSGPTATGLSAGVYTVSVMDADGCTADTMITITEPLLLEITGITLDNGLGCNGDGDASATATGTGGTAPIGYLWDANASNQATPTATGLSVGTYFVTITDANGCTDVESIMITEPPAVDMTSVVVSTELSCNGDGDAAATATGTGGTGMLTYLWDAAAGSQATQIATGLASGTYLVTVTDANGCMDVDSVTITDPPEVIMQDVTATSIACNGDMNASATATGTGGTGMLTYLWDAAAGNQATQTATGLGSGTYVVTVSDANNCTAVDSVTIMNPLAVAMDNVTQTVDVLCYGDSNGEATATGLGGTPPLNYLWDIPAGSQATATATGLGAGTYDVTVTDANGCTDVGSVMITEPTEVDMTSVIATNLLCAGDANASATATGTGGTGMLTYLWDSNASNQATQTATGLGANTYNVTVTDINGCTDVGSVTITDPMSVSMSGVVVSDELDCFGDANASATATGIGGTGMLTYLWDIPAGSQATQTATGLASGTYDVTVTDMNGCTDVGSVTIIDPPVVDMTSVIATDLLCNGDATASATATGIGGTGPLTYLWNALAGNQPTQTATGLGAGVYTVTVTDMNGCTDEGSVTITDPVAVAMDNVTQTVDLLCNGDANASATATGMGGSGGLTYLWDALAGNQPTQTATGLGAGTYSVTVTDANGCFDIGSVTITDPPEVDMTGVTATNLLCNGDVDASATATGIGGTGALTYLWDIPAGSQATQTATGLGAGTYSVTVTDANGCFDIGSVTIIDPVLLEMTSVTATLLDCGGDTDATATANGSGGTGPLSYLWDINAGSQATQTATGLSAGTYCAVVTDMNGCTVEGCVTIDDPVGVSMDMVTATDLLCNGDANASATATGSGGTGSLSYAWDVLTGNQTGPIATGLGAGTYSVTVSDINGCEEIGSVTIVDPPLLEMMGVVVDTDLLCNGDANASAMATGMGGTGNLSYEWDALAGGQMTQLATGLAAGTYSVTVTDMNGCFDIGSVTITDPPVVDMTGVTATDLLCYGDADASATATGIGGTGALSYLWDALAGNQATQTATGLAAGTYDVTVTDANGCFDIGSVTITDPTQLIMQSVIVATPLACGGDTDASATATGDGGTGTLTYLWGASTGGQATQTATGLGAGTHDVTVTDANGCMETGSVTITEPTPVVLVLTDSNDLDCFGDMDGSATVEGSGGTAPYSYLWDAAAGNQPTATANGLIAGTYVVTVTDALGCELDISVTLTQPAAALAASTLTVADATCGVENGSISIAVTGGTGTISYLWDMNANGQTGPVANDLGAGTYTVTITDANDCELIYSETVSTPSNFEANVLQVDSVTCNGLSNGNIFVNITGGSMPYSYEWDYPLTPTVQDLENIPAGPYSLTVTDFDGCEITLSTNVGEPDALTTMVETTEANCGEANGNINLTVEGGTAPYSYTWDGLAIGSGQDPMGLPRGTYNVTITDDKGCEIITSALIEEPNGPSFAPTTHVDAACFGTSTGSISVNVTGGTPPYTYDWSGGMAAPPIANPENLPAGVYQVIVTDVNSCSIDQTITITEPTELTSMVTNIIPATCGEDNGSVDVTVDGGTPPYTYLWNGSIAVQNPTNLPAGDYTLVATDDNGCTVTAFAQVIPPDGMMFEPTTVTDVNCFGGNDGAITLSLIGGNPPYTYVWDPPQGNIPNPSGLSSGVYLATVTDADDCPLETSITITEPDELIGQSFPVDASCANDDGVITLQIQGGFGVYTFSWTGPNSFVSASQDLTGLERGDYFLTITDANGCTYELMETIDIPDAPTAIAAPIDVDCFGNSTGSIAVAPTGGSGIYTYVWSGGVAGDVPLASDLPMGTYSVTITDTENCEFIIDNIIITEPALLELNGSTTQATCNQSNGTATSLTMGGTLPYTYEWSNGLPPMPDQTGLGVGTYTLTVTDGNGCSEVRDFVVGSPDDLQIATDHVDVVCFGESNGSITLVPTGGAPPFTYQWDNGAGMDQNPTGLPANTYNVVITDINGCTFVASETVNQPTEIDISLVSTTDATCNESNGAIDIAVSGGTTGYTFEWQNAAGMIVSTLEDPTLLPNGPYFVTITDGNNCTMTDQYNVDTPNQPNISSSSNPVSCFGGSDGYINVTVSGGAPGGFDYVWSNPTYNGMSELINIPAGDYFVTIIDADDCEFSAFIEVTEPEELLATTDVPLGVACNGGSTAAAVVVVTGGTLPYTYDWDDDSLDGQDAPSGLAAGTYTVTVIDGNDCEIVRTIEINEPPLLESSIIGDDADCFGAEDGAIEVFPNGGTGTYTYDWTGGLDPVANPANVPAGTYTVTITDANLCTVVNTVTIDQPTQVVLAVESVSDYAGFNVSCAELADGFATVISSGGTGPYTYLWEDGSIGATVENLPPGDFFVTVTDAQGCEQEEMISLTSPEPVAITPSVIPVRCNGDQNGMIFIDEASGGAAPYVYSLDESPFGSGVFPSLTGGWYELQAEDANGCMWSDSVWLPEPAPLELELGDDIEILFGDSVTLLPYSSASVSSLDTFAWTSPGVFTCPNPLDESCWEIEVKPTVTMQYNLMIRDENNCVSEDQIVVRVKKERLVYIPSGFAPDGDFENNVFMIYAGRGVTKVNKFFVYDRWGEIVFEAFNFNPNDRNFGWDGTLKGEPMNPAVFVYVAEVEFADESSELYSGDVTLWR